MKIGYVQSSPSFGKKEENFARVLELIGDAKADLIVLPELFATGYTFVSKEEAEKLAENKSGATSDFLKKLSKQTGAILVGGFIEEAKGEIYNSSMIVYKDEFIDTYRKIHLYFKEKLWFKPGDEGFKVFEINDIKLGVMICFDWIYPEAMRTLAVRGAEIIAHPTNLVLPFCQNATITRCIENRVFSITANRIGTEKRGEDEFRFTGASQITAPTGEVLSSAPKDEEFMDFAEIDIALARNKTLNDYNNLFDDRRPEFYIK